MKAVLEFDLPEEQTSFAIACVANKLYCFREDVYRIIRDKLKHGELTDEQEYILEKLREELLADDECQHLNG